MRLSKVCFAFFMAAFTLAGVASTAMAGGEVIVVDTLDDVSDVAASSPVSELPGADGRVSFREACDAANSTPGPQTIHFAIPQSQWWLITNIALLRNEGSAFFLIDDGTIVDFTTQTAFTGDTNPNGNEVGIYGTHPSFLGVPGIWISGDNCVIKGLDRVMQRGYGVRISGHDNRVIGCTISGPLFAGVYITGGFEGVPASGNIIGGMQSGEGNSLSAGNSGVRIDGPAENNIVIGNFLTGSFSGAEVRSASCCPGNEAINNRVGGPTPAERNVISGAGHYGEEGFPTGSQVSVEYATGTIVEGNFIGTTVDGNAAFPNQRGPGGVQVTNAQGTIVRNNLISGIAVNGVNHYQGQRFGIGISFEGNSAGSTAQGNLIGTNAAGTGPVPNRSGVTASFWPGMQASGGILVGGAEPGEGNMIAFNETHGVAVQAVVNNVRISGNSIHSNGTLGIDLIGFGPLAFGPTPNDVGDPDSGGNGLQNFPVLTSAGSSGNQTTIEGTFNSTPGETFQLEFFASPACDPSGFGEGFTFLGSVQVATDGAGNAAFGESVATSLPEGSVVTATATNSASGNTSEFSACLAAVVNENPADLNGDGSVDGVDLGILLAEWTPTGASGCKSSCDADLNGDGRINGIDLGILLGDWTG